MNSHRIKVLNTADDHAVVGLVAHYFKLVFLPSNDGSLNQDFTNRTCVKTVGDNLQELFHRVRDTRAATTQDVCRTNDDRKTNLFEYLQRLFHVVGDTTSRNTETNLNHRLLELVTIFCRCNCLSIRTDQFRSARDSNKTLLKQCHREVETSLSTKCWQNCVGLFTFDDLRQNLRRERFDVRAVRKIRISHDGGGVRVRKDNAITLRFQHTACLCSRVVKLAGLSDHNRPRANNQDGVDVITAWHQLPSIISANCVKR